VASDDRRLIAADRYVIDTRTGHLVRELEVGGSAMCFTRNGRIVAVARAEVLTIVEVESGRTIREITDPRIDALHQDVVTHVDFAPNDSIIVTGAKDGRIKLWDVANGELLLSAPVGADNLYPVFSSDGKFLATTANRSAIIYEVNASTVLTSMALQTGVLSDFDVTLDSELLACVADVTEGTRVSTWSISRNVQVDSWTIDATSRRTARLAIQDDGSRLVLSHNPSNTIHLWDLDVDQKEPGTSESSRTQTARSRELAVKNPGPITLARTANLLWTVSDELVIKSWSLPELAELSPWDNSVIGTAFGVGTITSLDAGYEWMVAGTKNRSVYLFNHAASMPSNSIVVKNQVSSLAISHDESCVASGASDGYVQISAIPHGELIFRWKAHRDEITSIEFTANDQQLATASRDGSIKLWQREDDKYQPVLTLRTSGSIETIRYSKDGNQLLALIRGESGIRVWDIEQVRNRLQAMTLDW